MSKKPQNPQQSQQDELLKQQQEIAQMNFERQQIDNFIQTQIRDSKRIRFIIFRQQRCLVARTVLAGSVQRVTVQGLNHDKMAFDELEKALQQRPLVVGNQVFRQGRRVPIQKGEALILENSQNSDVDRCVVLNEGKTQLLVGFNITSAIVNYDVEAQRVLAEAAPLMGIVLVQPPKPKPVPIFNFEEESLRNTPLFIFNNLYFERANNHPVEPTKADFVCLVTVNPRELYFEWYCQQCVAMMKRYENMAMFVVVNGLTPQNMEQLLALSPFVGRLNLVYDNLASSAPFFCYLTHGQAKHYQQELVTNDIDELYARLQDLVPGDREIPEDNELIVRGGQGITFMGLDLGFINPDLPEEGPKEPPPEPGKTYKRVKDNAVSNELYEVEGDDEGDDEADQEPEPEPEPEAEDEDQEERRDPLNTYVLAFWNPRHRDFQSQFAEFLGLAVPENIRRLTEPGAGGPQGPEGAAPPPPGDDPYAAVAGGLGGEKPEGAEGAENAEGAGAAEAAEGAENADDAPPPPPPKKEEEFKPYLRLYTCIQGSRQINIKNFERKLSGMTDLAKVILDDDWLFKKIQAIFNNRLTARSDQKNVDLNDQQDVGFFYVYNRQFKNIFEGDDFEAMANLVRGRGIVRKGKRKEEDE